MTLLAVLLCLVASIGALIGIGHVADALLRRLG